MSKEQEIIDGLRFKVGDEEFKFLTSASAALASVIYDDIQDCWPKWMEASKLETNSQGHTISVNLTLMSALIAQAVASLPDAARAEGRAKFETFCGMMFDLHAEALADAKKPSH